MRRRRVGEDQVRDLGRVDARAAADRDEAVRLVLEGELDSGPQGVDRRLDASAVVANHETIFTMEVTPVKFGQGASAGSSPVTVVVRAEIRGRFGAELARLSLVP